MTTLRAWRRQRRQTQRALAKASGVSEVTIRAIEHGYGQLRWRTMSDIARALGIRPDDVDEFRPRLGLSDPDFWHLSPNDEAGGHCLSGDGGGRPNVRRTSAPRPRTSSAHQDSVLKRGVSDGTLR